MIDRILIFLRGVCMGVADAIPGVSGGTIAMIVGIYERLVTAISRCDATFVSHILHLRWRKALAHVDFGFVITLLAGIVTGILAFSSLVLYLLENHLPVTFAAFTGLILGSVWILFRKLRSYSVGTFLMILLGAVCAWWIVGLKPTQGADSALYIFICGMIAICAMILPGISGSYILLILGKYAFIIDKVKRVSHLDATVSDLLTLSIFAAGCLVGLLSFSKLLKWLLKHYHTAVLALLTGFMLGSLRCLYPFQRMVGESHFETLDISTVPVSQFANVGISFVLSLLFILLLERVARKPS
ncbi:MAG: DUF368 domain-containing protein [Planctomycetia bacterium]|nr:DUF368 domain-containing protein [Planctomycetia bacterium]